MELTQQQKDQVIDIIARRLMTYQNQQEKMLTSVIPYSDDTSQNFLTLTPITSYSNNTPSLTLQSIDTDNNTENTFPWTPPDEDPENPFSAASFSDSTMLSTYYDHNITERNTDTTLSPEDENPFDNFQENFSDNATPFLDVPSSFHLDSNIHNTETTETVNHSQLNVSNAQSEITSELENDLETTVYQDMTFHSPSSDTDKFDTTDKSESDNLIDSTEQQEIRFSNESSLESIPHESKTIIETPSTISSSATTTETPNPIPSPETTGITLTDKIQQASQTGHIASTPIPTPTLNPQKTDTLINSVPAKYATRSNQLIPDTTSFPQQMEQEKIKKSNLFVQTGDWIQRNTFDRIGDWMPIPFLGKIIKMTGNVFTGLLKTIGHAFDGNWKNVGETGLSWVKDTAIIGGSAAGIYTLTKQIKKWSKSNSTSDSHVNTIATATTAAVATTSDTGTNTLIPTQKITSTRTPLGQPVSLDKIPEDTTTLYQKSAQKSNE